MRITHNDNDFNDFTGFIIFFNLQNYKIITMFKQFFEFANKIIIIKKL
jgi:hypothetical protein